MNTDRDLLELAAKAAGYNWPLKWPHPSPVDVPHDWNPLTDDGDALRLAVKLNIGILPMSDIDSITATCDAGEFSESYSRPRDYAATRRAIVRAAAAIGAAL